MALKAENAIRTEIIKGKNHTQYRLHYFKCLGCIKEVKSRAAYLKKHSGFCRTCSSKKTIKFAQGSNKLRPFEARYNNFLSRIKDETDLSYQDYLEFTKVPNCHYCERKINWEPYGENTPGFFLDRKNNNIGHLKLNLVVCCGDCNKTKRNYFTYEEFVLLSPILKQIRSARK